MRRTLAGTVLAPTVGITRAASFCGRDDLLEVTKTVTIVKEKVTDYFATASLVAAQPHDLRHDVDAGKVVARA